MAIAETYRITYQDQSGLRPDFEWSEFTQIDRARLKKHLDEHLSGRGKELFDYFCYQSEDYLEVAREIALYFSLDILDPGGRPTFSTVLESALESAHEGSHENSPTTPKKAFATQVLREMHRTFNFKVTSTPRGSKPNKVKIWDCMEEGICQWMLRNKIKTTQIEPISPEWTSIARHDGGLLFARNLLSSSNIKQVLGYADTDIEETQHLSPVAEKLKNERSYVKYSECLKMQIAEAEFVNPSIKVACDRFAAFFSNQLLSKGQDIPFIEVELAKALAVWHATYSIHGASMGYIRFCESIFSSLELALRLTATAKGDTWDWAKEGLSQWLYRHQEYPVALKIQTYSKGPKTRRSYALATRIFSRSDLSIWRIPLPGKEQGNFWGDFIYGRE